MMSHYNLQSLAASPSSSSSSPAGLVEASHVQTSPLTLLVFFGGICFAYVAYAVFQEALYRLSSESKGYFEATCFFLLVQTGTCMVVSGLLLQFKNRMRVSMSLRAPKSPLSLMALYDMDLLQYASCGFSYLGAMYFSNEALKYVNYPSQALAKSCKIVPVMLFDIMSNRRQYNVPQSASILIIALGMSTFLSSDVVEHFEAFPIAGGKASIHYGTDDVGKSLYGNVLLFLSLTLDGVTSAAQGLIKHSKPSPDAHTLMFSINLWAFLCVLLLAAGSGQVFSGIAYCRAEPDAAVYIAAASAASAIGQIFVFYTLVGFNATVLATMSSIRKLLTICVSVTFFNNHLTSSEVAGVAIVFTGVFVDLAYRSFNGEDPKVREKAKAQ
jgi:UDP-galactose transporter B1